MDYYVAIFQVKQDHRWFNDEYYGPFNSRQLAENWVNHPENNDLDPSCERFIIQYLKPIG